MAHLLAAGMFMGEPDETVGSKRTNGTPWSGGAQNFKSTSAWDALGTALFMGSADTNPSDEMESEPTQFGPMVRTMYMGVADYPDERWAGNAKISKSTTAWDALSTVLFMGSADDDACPGEEEEVGLTLFGPLMTMLLTVIVLWGHPQSMVLAVTGEAILVSALFAAVAPQGAWEQVATARFGGECDDVPLSAKKDVDLKGIWDTADQLATARFMGVARGNSSGNLSNMVRCNSRDNLLQQS